MKSIRTIYYKIREKILNLKFIKLRNCNLPYSFFDTRSHAWVYKRRGKYQIENFLEYALGDIAGYSLTYHYESKIINHKEEKIDISHCHNFDEVIDNLYNNPETFRIPDEFLSDYSTQQLNYLKVVQSYLKAIGLKDKRKHPEYYQLTEQYDQLYKNKNNLINKIKMYFIDRKIMKFSKLETIKRCSNLRNKEFENYRFMWKDEYLIEDILNGKRDYIINKYPKKKQNQRCLLMKKREYVGIIEYQDGKKIKLKELTEDMVDKGKYKTFKEYKKALLKDYQVYDEEFNENSYIYIYKIKLIEKF